MTTNYDLVRAITAAALEAAEISKDGDVKAFLGQIPVLAEEISAAAWKKNKDSHKEAEALVALTVVLDTNSKINEAIEYESFAALVQESLGHSLPPIWGVPKWVRRRVNRVLKGR